MTDDYARAPFRPLPSKIHMPAQCGNAVKRDRVVEKMNSVEGRSLTTVVSPAGFGKTTAVRGWARESSSMPVAWLLAEKEDASPSRFWSYVAAALGQIEGFDSGKLLASFREAAHGDELALVEPLLLSMADHEGEFAFVIEDLHTVYESEEVMRGVEYLVRHLPDQAHVVITARQKLPFPLAKLRMSGALGEITEADLRLTPEGQRAFFEMEGIDLSEEENARLAGMVQGWPAGLRLISLVCEGFSGAQTLSAFEGAKGALDEYLLEEVVDGLSGQCKRLCVLTSVVEAFSISLAADVCGLSREQAGDIVDALLSEGVFIEHIGFHNGEDWFRYHQMLRDALRGRLSRLSVETESAAKRTACQWLLGQGYVDEALALAADLSDFDTIRNAIIKNWKRLFMSDDHAVLVRWLGFLPEAEVLKSPMLCAVASMPTALYGNFEAAERYIALAISRLHDERDFCYSLCMCQKAYLASFREDSLEMRKYSGMALRYLPEEECYLRGMMLQIGASGFSETDPLRTKALFIDALAEQSKLGNKELLCSAYSNLALTCANLGHVGESRRYAQQAFGLYPKEERASRNMLAYAIAAEAVCMYNDGRYEEAARNLEEFDSAFESNGLAMTLAQMEALRAKLRHRDGKPFEKCLLDAFAIDERGASLAYPSLRMVEAYCETYRAQARDRIFAKTEALSLRLFNYACAFAQNAVSLFEDLCALADSINPDECTAKLFGCCLAAAFSEKVAHMRRAEAYFEQACEIAYAHGLAAIIEENAGYLGQTAKRVIARRKDDQIASWIEARIARAHASAGEKQTVLSDRELDAIRYISLGLTVGEAAKRMYVSRETVKKHLSNIYAKLGVHSKIQALAILREQGII